MTRVDDLEQSASPPIVYRLLEHEEFIENAEFKDDTMLSSFYVRNDPDKAEHSLRELQTRLDAIIQTNPWIMARCMKFREGGETLCQLELDPNAKASEYIFLMTNDAVFDGFNESYEKVSEVLIKYAVGNGKTCMGVSGDPKKPGKPLSRFTLIQNTDKTRLCICITMNHIIADGATLYTVYKMLDSSQPIIKMDNNRITNYTQLLHENLSALPSKPDGTIYNLKDTAKVEMDTQMCAYILNGFGNFFNRVKQRQYIFRVNQACVDEIKNTYNTGTSFVSTNDVLHHWFGQMIGQKVDNVYMAVNVRSRIAEIESSRPGNYLLLAPFRTAHMTTPKTVRDTLKRFLAPGWHWQMPSHEDVRRSQTAMHTNWTSFYHHLEPAGYEQIQHMPIVKPYGDFMGPVFVGFAAALITYYSNKNELSVMIQCNRKSMTKAKLDSQPILGQEILKTPGK